jgi:predicted ATPase/DNA-binding SARP family transcriptional activator
MRQFGAVEPLRIQLFGTFHVVCGGEPLPHLRSQKGKWLLALLALHHGREVQRAWLAEQLWPDSDKAQDSLNTTLSNLRRALGAEEQRLTATRRTLCLDLEGANVDLIAFDAAIATGNPVSLRAAVDLYAGPLLEDCAELWVLTEREAHVESYAHALETLATQALTDGSRAHAIDYLRRAVTQTDSEIVHRRLMQTLADAGDYAEALQVYQQLRQRRQTQFRDMPEEATTALYLRLREVAHRRATVDNVSPTATPIPPRIRIPRPLTPLLGREEELNEITARLLSNRLVTLTGPGGVGKTRLATEAALCLAHEFAHGACFVELHGLTDPQRMPQRIAVALEIERAGDWLKALIDLLRDRHLLLVLDNCEHLLDPCAGLTRKLLSECAGLHILATSRERLGLTGEIQRTVPPLAAPPLHSQRQKDYPAIQLFCERAEAINPHSMARPEDILAATRICRRLDGLPLAIELAAALVASLPVQEIADRTEKTPFQTLNAGDRTAPQRHQALTATLRWSFDLLTDEERQMLICLCVFTGGWTLSAAEAVFGSPPKEAPQAPRVRALLARLSAKSLIELRAQEDVERYAMLETIRAYGRELARAAAHWQLAQRRHCEYYTAYAEAAEGHLTGAEQLIWLSRLDDEIDNLRAALAWALDVGGDETLGLRLAGALWRYWYSRGYLEEGQTWLSCAVSLNTDPPPPPRLKAIQGLGNLCYARDDNLAARRYYEECVTLAEALGDRRIQASALASLANVKVEEGHHEEARAHFEVSLRLFREGDDRRGAALTLSNLAIVECAAGSYTAARALHKQGLELFRQLGAHQNIALEANNYAHTLLQLRALEEVAPLLAESLELSRTLKNLPVLAHCLTNYRSLATAQGDMRRPATLLGTEMALRDRIDFPLPAMAQDAYRQDETAMRICLGDTAFEACHKQGERMSEAEIYRYAGRARLKTES